MSAPWTRRSFLQATGAASTQLGGFASLLAKCPGLLQDPKVTPELVRLGPDIEPLVRLIEATPLERCFEVFAAQLRAGLPYRQLMAALFLTGIRNFKSASTGAMHSVFLMHSVHQFSLDARPEDRLLPLFFALDNLVTYREQVAKSGPHEPLLPLQGTLPAAAAASDEFRAAMDDWDGERADRAMVVLLRTRGMAEIGEHLWPYAARDQNHIGHKAIFVANAWRTLQAIGWQHAEPVLRALSLALVSYHMRYAKAARERFDQQPYLANVERVREMKGQLPVDWAGTGGDAGPTHEVLALLHDGRTNDACALAASLLRDGKARAGALWDAVHLGAAELMMRQPGIDGVHAVTSSNALHFCFRASGRTESRLLILLQAIGWLGLFHATMAERGLHLVHITELTPGEVPADEVAAAREVLAEPPFTGSLARGGSWTAAAGPAKAFRCAQLFPEAEALCAQARQLIFRKATEEHEYKFPAAIFEDYRLVDARWRPHMLAAAVYFLRNASEPDSPVMQRAREALGVK
ncbi:MAG TPA: hypothetical protein VFZ65_06550 [Planctomycetota bacterium]|nr:hypothetical protein [Planctomycetota bacterium]